MIGRRLPIGLPATVLACVAAAAGLGAGWEAVPPAAAVAAEEVRALCSREGYAESDFWEVARALGIAAAIVEEETFSDLQARGEALSFTRAEIERLRALGLLTPAAAARPEAHWLARGENWPRVLAAAARAGVKVATAAASGYRIVEFPEGYEPGGLPLGLPPTLAARLAAQGVRPLPAAGLTRARYKVRTLPLSASAAAQLRAARSAPGGILRLTLGPGGVEETLGMLRSRLRELRSEGALALEAVETAAAPTGGGWRWPVLAWLAGFLGPLVCVRAALQVLRRAGAWAPRAVPAASPVLELAAAAAAAAGAGAAFGLIQRFAYVSSPALLPENPWTAAALGPPLALAALALFGPDWAEISKLLRRPVTVGGLLGAAGLAALCTAVLSPEGIPGWKTLRAGAGPWLDENLGWWARWRWREALVGYPCLVQALALLHKKWNCPDCADSKTGWASGDPRGWLLAGLAAPVAVMCAFANAGLPAEEAAYQSAWAAGVGGILGGVLVCARVARAPSPAQAEK